MLQRQVGYQPSALRTPIPVRHAVEHLPEALKESMRRLRAGLEKGDNPAAERPEAVIAYCLELLGPDPFIHGPASLSSAYELLRVYAKEKRRPLLHLGTALSALLLPPFEAAWCAETADPRLAKEWSPRRPSQGQQIATALVLQRLIGGRLLIAAVDGYGLQVWNDLGSEDITQELDLTRSQYPDTVHLMRGSRVEVEKGDQLCRFTWAEAAAKQLEARVRDQLIAYAFAAYALVHPPPTP